MSAPSTPAPKSGKKPFHPRKPAKEAHQGGYTKAVPPGAETVRVPHDKKSSLSSLAGYLEYRGVFTAKVVKGVAEVIVDGHTYTRDVYSLDGCSLLCTVLDGSISWPMMYTLHQWLDSVLNVKTIHLRYAVSGKYVLIGCKPKDSLALFRHLEHVLPRRPLDNIGVATVADGKVFVGNVEQHAGEKPVGITLFENDLRGLTVIPSGFFNNSPIPKLAARLQALISTTTPTTSTASTTLKLWGDDYDQ